MSILYLGSVRFYKHLIAILLIIAFLGLIAGVVWLSVQNSTLRGELAALEEKIEELSKPVSKPEPSPSASPSAPPSPTVSPVPTEPDDRADVKVEYEHLSYHDEYSELYSERPDAFTETERKTAYLTFNGGPGENTEALLDTLARHDIKAAFFILGKNIEGNEQIIKRMHDEGHEIGILCYSLDFHRIYESVEAFLADFEMAYTALYEKCGIKASIFRFPGGSINGYNSANYKEIIAEMLRRGFTYYDWNISAGDDGARITQNKVKSNILADYAHFNRGIVILHEKSPTIAALGDVIEAFRQSGYSIEKLTNNVKPVIFAYPR